MDEWYAVLGNECDMSPNDPGSIAARGCSGISTYEIIPLVGILPMARQARANGSHMLHWDAWGRTPIVHDCKMIRVLDIHAAVEHLLSELHRLRYEYENNNDTEDNIRTLVLHLELSILATMQNICFASNISGAYLLRDDLIGGLNSNFVNNNADSFYWIVQCRHRAEIQRYARRIGIF